MQLIVPTAMYTNRHIPLVPPKFIDCVNSVLSLLPLLHSEVMQHFPKVFQSLIQCSHKEEEHKRSKKLCKNEDIYCKQASIQ